MGINKNEKEISSKEKTKTNTSRWVNQGLTMSKPWLIGSQFVLWSLASMRWSSGRENPHFPIKWQKITAGTNVPCKKAAFTINPQVSLFLPEHWECRNNHI